MRKRILALGFFDGVHLGHGALLRRTKELAEETGAIPAALTFDTHPDELVHGHPVPLLNTAQERAMLMRQLYGIEEVITLPFDRNTMTQPWEDFVEKRLWKEYCAVHVVCGHDFRFGAGGAGNAPRLKEKCHSLAMGCDIIPEFSLYGETVSSTRIRSLLAQGRMEEAVACLGHPHLLTGTVEHGRQLGRTLGIPTANLWPAEGLLLPKFGVYAALARFDGLCRMAVVNIGSRPTVQGHRVTVEPWILDFDGDLYGHSLELSLYRFLRAEQKFDSLEALKTEIHKNAEETRQFFKNKPQEMIQWIGNF